MTDSPDHLHPRPQMRRSDWTDLCGAWGFAHDDRDVGLDACWQASADPFTRQITVPFPPESALSGIGDKGYHPVVWYRREVDLAAPAGGERVLLHFGAVDYAARVWLNGQLVASHEGGHASFCADITTALTDGGPQVVVVRAEDQPLDAGQPRGKQDWEARPHTIFYDRTTGIWQPVWLETAPAVHVTDLHIVPDLAAAGVSVTVELNAAPPDGASVEIALRSDDRRLARVCADATRTSVRLDIHLAAFEHGMARGELVWTPETPNLIDMTATLRAGNGTALDTVESYFGLRSCAAAGRRFLLNDKPYFVRSVLEQGYWPQSHLAAPDADALRREVELIKSLGFNAVRIHQKVEDPRFLYWADRLGLLVWGEMAAAYEFSPRAVERFTREWLEVVRRDRNHPCIVTWVPINESWGVTDIALRSDQRAFASALYHLTHALDPTRPVISNDGWEHTESDILGIHDYALKDADLRDRYASRAAIAAAFEGQGPQRRRLMVGGGTPGDQPIMITEFGGVSYFPEDGSDWFGYATVTTDEAYLAQLTEIFDALLDSPELAGFCYTQFTDTLQERNGLLTEDRNPKLPPEKLRAIISRPSKAIPAEYLDAARRRAFAAGTDTPDGNG